MVLKDNFSYVMLFYDNYYIVNLYKSITPSHLYNNILNGKAYTPILENITDVVLNSKHLRRYFNKYLIPGNFNISNPFIIEYDECDSLNFYIDDKSGVLENIHNIFRKKLPHFPKNDIFKPYCTLATIKKGLGKYYVDLFKNDMYIIFPYTIGYYNNSLLELKIYDKNRITSTKPLVS